MDRRVLQRTRQFISCAVQYSTAAQRVVEPRPLFGHELTKGYRTCVFITELQ
jgi:hypothetical protein